jgi:hypothetical protein
MISGAVRANLRRGAIVLAIVAAFGAGVATELSSDGQPDVQGRRVQSDSPGGVHDIAHELAAAAVRLPVAAVLGAILALRPRRNGAARKSVVVQTQIALSVVGALIMLIVGASLARAFGIVGIASLVRYRSKINDPKDAVVMLSALAVGLACGVGLFFLAFFATAFLVGTLWIIESFEPETRAFELTVRLGEGTAGLRSRIESVLRRFASEYELRASSVDEASYFVRAPKEFNTVGATEALTGLVPGRKGAVEWAEKSKAS